MILSAIAAMSRNRVIGINNQLPWHIPEDLKYFKEKTKDKVIIMGRKTFESFQGKLLPNRVHIVITRQKDFSFNNENVKVVNSLSSAIELAKNITKSQEVFVIGGSETYAQVLPLLDRLYLTVINKEFAGDAYFPEFDQASLKLISEDKKSGELEYSFQVYER